MTSRTTQKQKHEFKEIITVLICEDWIKLLQLHLYRLYNIVSRKLHIKTNYEQAKDMDSYGGVCICDWNNLFPDTSIYA